MRSFAVVSACLLLLPCFASGQSEAPTFWYAQYEHTFVDSELPQWSDWKVRRVGAYHDLGSVTLGAEGASTERFGLDDISLTIDAFADLWDGAYVNVRGRGVSDADVLPSWDARAELFQSLGGGWEGSVMGWRMAFSGPDVDIGGVGLARYQGNWYLRARAMLSRTAGESAGSVAVSARRFLGGARQSIEFSAGTGEEAVVLGAGPRVELRTTRFAQVVAQRYFSRRFGFWALGAYNSFEGAPSRFSLGVGLTGRLGGAR